ncbi:MAG: flagellar protein FliS [Planctomycetes bacterium]|nr:flagellar protein FliS [Planctomycetota bacterium]
MKTGYQAYQQDSVLALPREQILLRIYDALLRRIEEARLALEGGDRGRTGVAIGKSLDIVAALRDALNPVIGAECMPKLDQLYRTVSAWLVEANLQQSPQFLESSRRVVGTLKEGWDGAVRSAR